MKKQKITAKAMSLFLAFLLAAGLTACFLKILTEIRLWLIMRRMRTAIQYSSIFPKMKVEILFSLTDNNGSFDHKNGLLQHRRPFSGTDDLFSYSSSCMEQPFRNSRRITSPEMPGILSPPHTHLPCWTPHRAHAYSVLPRRCQSLPFRNLP